MIQLINSEGKSIRVMNEVYSSLLILLASEIGEGFCLHRTKLDGQKAC